MAELPQLGKHCHVESCNRLDFLPFECVHCKNTFCSDHRTSDAHVCDQVQTHILSDKEAKCSRTGTLFGCTFSECTQKELTPIACGLCAANFCVRHRHAQDHKCKCLQSQAEHMPLTTKVVQKILESKKPAEKTMSSKASISPTAQKVKLMKMKMHAAGEKNVPLADRVYFEVYFPKGHKLWTVGRAIDSTAIIEKLPNQNNRQTEKRLLLFRASTLKALGVSDSFETLLNSKLLNEAETLVLEYVPPNCDSLSADYNFEET
ncbi:AN1-type zinc finger protein 1 isoform X2 [Rhipicephalus sanguineus]|uniref:AN1-type zinc finger protein 1 isoform X2 n=1 Tax=Rhipicephalus sanguineus TaxID=34632 RepID=UPI00189455BB|nr:AN1-type zinc finger protein 1 isoform X2 [Rhipicephalus sanguineus]